MFVVGTRARNLDADGVSAVGALKTGFVQSWMWVVQIPAGQPPFVMAESATPGSGQPIPATTGLTSINLNRDYAQSGLEELPTSLALAQPTDIVVLEGTDNPTGIDKVFITAYHSDKVAVLAPDPVSPSGWLIRRIPIPLNNQGDGYTMAGPRGLAVSSRARSPHSPTRPGLVFCLNRLNNTVSVLDPHLETVIATFPLQNDPTPRVIRRGRRFLYGAGLSRNGAVSCASCHIDGRTDGLVFRAT
jgi:hypothetical protein